jgi:hypothetical protein
VNAKVGGFASASVAAVALVASQGGAASGPTPSWTCIAGICLGHSRASLGYRFGRLAADIPSRRVSVRGGHVWACFWRCTNAVTEDGFTYYGGRIRPADRVLTVSTCDRLFRLRDGITTGTPIPFGQRWHGYRRITLEGGVFGWKKRVRLKTQTAIVTLSTVRGRVRCVDLERA